VAPPKSIFFPSSYRQPRRKISSPSVLPIHLVFRTFLLCSLSPSTHVLPSVYLPVLAPIENILLSFCQTPPATRRFACTIKITHLPILYRNTRQTPWSRLFRPPERYPQSSFRHFNQLKSPEIDPTLLSQSSTRSILGLPFLHCHDSRRVRTPPPLTPTSGELIEIWFPCFCPSGRLSS